MRKKIANIMVLALLAAGTSGWAVAQAKEDPPDRAVVPLSSPDKPAKIEVTVIRGSITVKAYQGKEIIVEARTREKALATPNSEFYGQFGAIPAPPKPGQPVPPTAPAPTPSAIAGQREAEAAVVDRDLARQEALAKQVAGQYDKAIAYYSDYDRQNQKQREEKEKKIAGMKQLGGSTSGLEIEEQDNVVEISVQSWKAATDLVIQVPVATSLEVRSSMDGAVLVEGVSGEVDINNFNGPVTVKNVSGNTLVHTINGNIEVTLARVAADKPLSFSSMTGDIDVTLPADIKANVKMKSEQGEIYTDFDVNMTRQATKAETAEKTEQGKFRITFDKSLYGTINGGGREIAFNTFNGDIYIRKKK